MAGPRGRGIGCQGQHLGVELVGQGLKEDGGGGDLLAIGGVVAVGQMATAGQVKAHDAVVGLQEGCVHCEVGWAGATHTTQSSASLQKLLLERKLDVRTCHTHLCHNKFGHWMRSGMYGYKE